MQHTIQRFPAVNIESLPNGLFRLEDETCVEGIASIDLHPVQIQLLASLVGYTLPDKTAAALARVASRLKTIQAQVSDLESKLRYALTVQDIDIAPEMVSAEFIGTNLGEVLKDLDDLAAPELEPMTDALANPGGQLTLPL
jgi:hypothetical protein